MKRHLLPSRASLTGAYSKRQLDQIAGYFVLVHAEIESYFEDMALELIDASIQKWRDQQKLNRALLSMLVYYEGERKGPPQSFDQNQFKDRKLESVVHEAANQHRSRVRGNNGIREKDLSEILFPVGFSYSDLDTTLVASLDSFGKRRGDFAHQSLAKAVSAAQIDPFVEATSVNSIIGEIEKVDPTFDRLSR